MRELHLFCNKDVCILLLWHGRNVWMYQKCWRPGQTQPDQYNSPVIMASGNCIWVVKLLLGKKKWCSEEIMGLVNCPCRLYVACVWFGQCWWSVPSSNAVTYSIRNALLIALLSLVLGIHPCLAGGFMFSSWRNFWGANSSSRWAGIWYRGVRSEHAEQLSIAEMIAVLRALLAGQSLAALPGL